MGAALLILFAVCGATYLLYTFRRSRAAAARMPPGHKGLPIVGNLLDLSSDSPEVIRQWAKRLGDTVTVDFGSRKMVVLHDYDTAKAVFSDEKTTGRDPEFILNEVIKGKGLIFSEGDLWKQHRRFALSALRDLGMGKSWFEDAILEEIKDLISVFESHAGKPFVPLTPVTVSVSNVICALTFGKRFAHNDVTFQKLCTLVGDNLRILAQLTFVKFFPILKIIPVGKMYKLWRLALGNARTIQVFIRGLIKEHEASSDGPQDGFFSVGDYVESYRTEGKNPKNIGTSSDFTDEQLQISVANLFDAGTETTSTTLLWGFLYMMEYPEIQRKVQQEIDENIGTRIIRLEDKVLLKYTDAVTLEIQRLASTVPLSVIHTTLAPIVVDGYEIPARTLLTLNSYAMHRNPRYWMHPDVVFPEHFLDKSGSIRIPKGYAPFGVGKRECLGESLAKMELFLFFANLLQHFEIQAPGNIRPSLDKYTCGLVRSPLPYEVSFVVRSSNV